MSDPLARTLDALAARARWFLLAERGPDRDGFLQRATPTVKLTGLVVLVAVAATRGTVAGAAAVLALAGVLAVVSRVPARAFLGRVAGPAALSAVAVAPRALFAPGPALAGTPLSATGVEYALVFTLRAGAAVAFLALLPLTTSVSDLLAAARRLRVPPVVVALVGITYRYLLVLASTLGRMARARRARTVESRGLRRAWRDSGRFLSTFLLRGLERGERVGRAARARGGGGTATYDRGTAPGVADAALAVVVVAVVALAVAGPAAGVFA